MTNPQLIEISKVSLKKDFEIKLYRDRFDLAHVIKKLFINSTSVDNPECDPIKLVSLMTWEPHPLPENECKIVLEHFKSIEKMFKVSKDAMEYSLNSLEISNSTKQSIITFLSREQDYYI